jgi:hypothetical protein
MPATLTATEQDHLPQLRCARSQEEKFFLLGLKVDPIAPWSMADQ